MTTYPKSYSTRPQMTAQEAAAFDRYCEGHVQIIKSAVAERKLAGTYTTCNCEAYRDVFTYDRWKSQGFQVMRGEKKLCSVETWVEKKDAAGNVVKRFPWHSALFCRCQVKAADGKQAAQITTSQQVPEDIAIKALEQQAEIEQEQAAFLSDPDYRLGGKFNSLEL